MQSSLFLVSQVKGYVDTCDILKLAAECLLTQLLLAKALFELSSPREGETGKHLSLVSHNGRLI